MISLTGTPRQQQLISGEVLDRTMKWREMFDVISGEISDSLCWFRSLCQTYDKISKIWNDKVNFSLLALHYWTPITALDETINTI